MQHDARERIAVLAALRGLLSHGLARWTTHRDGAAELLLPGGERFLLARTGVTRLPPQRPRLQHRKRNSL